MLPALKDIKTLFHLEEVTSDNLAFKLHYKATLPLLTLFSLLLGLKQYFGDPIDCIADKNMDKQMLEKYCWVEGTFTILEYTYDSVRDLVPHPGVGQLKKGHTILDHAYYQWVPLVLAITAVTFYIPRFLWKSFEGGLMANICKALRFEDIDTRRNQVEKLRWYFMDSQYRNNAYAGKFILCELLNMVNVIIQWFLLDVFLGGAFQWYGAEFMRYFEDEDGVNVPKDHADPSDVVFPKVASCFFKRVGPGGKQVLFDSICVLPLNILNEKIFYILWFWYIVLMAVSAAAVLYRFLVVCPFACARTFLLVSSGGVVDRRDCAKVVENCSIGDWFVLRQIKRNIDPRIFADFVSTLAADFDNRRISYLKKARTGKGQDIFASPDPAMKLFLAEFAEERRAKGGRGDRGSVSVATEDTEFEDAKDGQQQGGADSRA